MSSTTPSDGTAAASGPSKKVIGSAVVVAVIVVLGLVLSLANLLGRQTDSPTTPPPPPVSSGAPTSTPPSDGSVCGLEAVEMTGTVSTAPSATWALVGTIAAPTIEGQGPGKIDDDGFRAASHAPRPVPSSRRQTTALSDHMVRSGRGSTSRPRRPALVGMLSFRSR